MCKKTLERAGFTVDKSIVITEFGMKKEGKLDLEETEVNDIIAKVENALVN